jgi:N-acetyl-gamma-glutamyl-phosphate reductase
MSAGTVHVLGAAGFTGAQLAALVARHPQLDLGTITARADAGRRLVDLYPEYRVPDLLVELDLASIAPGDIAAVCYPHAEAADLVGQLFDRGARIVDVSADHRLRDPALYPEVYGFTHPRQEILAQAVYGLPEMYRDAIRGARIVANPGCFPTASLLAILPLRERLDGVVIDAKSGVSGAGRTPTPTVHFSSVTENVTAYKVLTHRHAPEIAQEFGQEVLFTPHLVPVDRGLLASCYARFVGDTPHPDDLLAEYARFYADHPFVEVVDAPPGMRAVQGTNFAQVFVTSDPRRGLFVGFGVIDNLGKGAAGQALQNINLMTGRPETEGLLGD